MTSQAALFVAVLLVLPGVYDAGARNPYEALGLANRPRTQLPAIQSTEEGFSYLDTDGPVVGDGQQRTYRLEVEPATGVNPRVFTHIADTIITDERGWTGAGKWALQRVAADDADIRVLLATPRTVDRLCAKAGLDTHGEVSCWNGRFAALNAKRWASGADGFVGSLRSYREYLVNHEVGHGLGYGHEACPRRGARAPVMQQQTYATKPCKGNGWPVLDP